MTATISLFTRFPNLERGLPRQVLTQLPTPVTDAATVGDSIGVRKLLIKRDDLTGDVYGGNKVRKLEFLLGRALADGVKEVVTFGYAGSNHALATAIYSLRAGLKTTSVLLPQTNAAYVRRNISAAVAAGARIRLKPSERAIAAWVIRDQILGVLRAGKRPMLIPPGGSSPAGVAGFVNAGLELAEQIECGEVPLPDRIYMPISSMGSSVGLYIGLQLAGLRIPIHAVRVIEESYVSGNGIGKLLNRTVKFLRSLDSSVPEIRLDEQLLVLRHEHVGDGYARFSEEGMRAVQFVANRLQLPLEGTYSGKAFSCLISDAEGGMLADQQVLFWNTHNSRQFVRTYPLSDEALIPDPVRKLLDSPMQSLDQGTPDA